MSHRNRILAIGAATLLALGIATYAFTASSEERDRAHDMPMGRGMVGHGMMGPGMNHGMMRDGMAGRRMMGGMMGRDASARADLATIHELAADHDRIRRTVTNLVDGIRTVTESDDPGVARRIKEHVARMGERVRSGNMLGVPLESPAVHQIYENKDKIRTTTEPTDKGIVVVQTSADPKIAALLQQHAVEVSDLVRGGMAAMHAAMMRNRHGDMRGMPGTMMRGMPHGMGHDE